jgi:hypothetical protein
VVLCVVQILYAMWVAAMIVMECLPLVISCCVVPQDTSQCKISQGLHPTHLKHYMSVPSYVTIVLYFLEWTCLVSLRVVAFCK